MNAITAIKETTTRMLKKAGALSLDTLLLLFVCVVAGLMYLLGKPS